MESQIKEITRLIREGKTDNEIVKIMEGSDYRSTASIVDFMEDMEKHLANGDVNVVVTSASHELSPNANNRDHRTQGFCRGVVSWYIND